MQLAQLAQRARLRGADVGDLMRTGGSSTSAHILELAASGAYDLVVMGLHSDGGGMRVSASGVGCAVRLRSPIPVLSVRANDSHLPLDADDSLREPSLECSMSAIQAHHALQHAERVVAAGLLKRISAPRYVRLAHRLNASHL